MIVTRAVSNFEEWRTAARPLLDRGVPPADVRWLDSAAGPECALSFDFSGETADEVPKPSVSPSAAARVPPLFLDLARLIACHAAADRFELLYRLLWRLTRGEPRLLEQPCDADVLRARGYEKSVRRDIHKMKAFVRFRRHDDADGEFFFAFHRPDHRILREVAGFFAERFGTMRWAIATPFESVGWDRRSLTFGPGIAHDVGDRDGSLEELWTTYYRSIFNPARLNLKVMRRELPVRHWPTLPESKVIGELSRSAADRTAEMVREREGSAVSAADFLPAETDLASLRKAAESCEGCPLHRDATQTVFGVGPASARVVLVGEQPGDSEDRAGEPFVGPAGKMLDDALAEAGIDRATVYVTNAVKHFKFKPMGGRRLHQKPGVREVNACKPWLAAELDTIRPGVLVCLGATAAQAIMGPGFRITKQRGDIQATEYSLVTLATYHPSAILRAPDPDARERLYQFLVADLKAAMGQVGASG